MGTQQIPAPSVSAIKHSSVQMCIVLCYVKLRKSYILYGGLQYDKSAK